MTSITEINITNMNISLLLLLRFLYKARNETINNKTPSKSANNE